MIAAGIEFQYCLGLYVISEDLWDKWVALVEVKNQLTQDSEVWMVWLSALTRLEVQIGSKLFGSRCCDRSDPNRRAAIRILADTSLRRSLTNQCAIWGLLLLIEAIDIHPLRKRCIEMQPPPLVLLKRKR